MGDSATLESLIGAADNLDEPEPVWNRAAMIIALTIVFGLMGSIGTVCMCLSPGMAGLGRHYVLLTSGEQEMHLKLFYIADGSFVSTVSLIKLSLLLQYLRIFDSGIRRHLCLAAFAVVATWAVVTSFMAWFPCFPIHAYWNWSVSDKKCYGYGSEYVAGHYATFLAHGIVNMILDLVILALPLPLLFRPGTIRRTKLGLCGLLTLGVIANVLAALRLAETIRHKAMTYPTFDPTWYGPSLCLLGMLEVNIACIGASVPVFWPVFRNKLDAIFVTHEINVSVADRSSDDMHLQPQRSESLYSHDESDGNARLYRDRSGGGGGPGSRGAAHYNDTYVMDQVDPLRKKTILTVNAVVTTGSGEDLRKNAGSSHTTALS
ncbi:hypothetical protein ACRE_047550 [Hapsidospora chrysogenum ATCC 11550]|uniref:Rhodopsin domain-containing protein n=1 Tax=Hapsidospora chrysogenum (strain ATCC 11550 / CBS 779.69 / DSM 880 / IAM 14645 / JCM 23072 / IMI 49137) TaxID=857340 RepID=A0A086T4Y8_HAPC1|nr:hypothetical protein ACRE_047550 [Hapsidospora chrysogenum ATCC 11550]